MTDIIHTDVAIIGAGPVGLFAVFELGLYDMKAVLIDTLDKVGGQCAELYPEKPIYDIPAFPMITGDELTQNLMKQIEPFAPQFLLQQSAKSLEKKETGWILTTSDDIKVHAKVVLIAAGGGVFSPKKPALEGLAAYEGHGIFYAVKKSEQFRDKNIIIAGGGDSAVDWALFLQPIAKNVTLLHHRGEFRAAPDSVRKLYELQEQGKIAIEIAKLQKIIGDAPDLTGLQVQKNGEEVILHADMALFFYGLTMKAGALADFGIHMHNNLVPVDTEKFETNIPSIFAIGDINTYAGKQKLILSGFHEAALMAKGAFSYVHPDKKFRFQYTTSSSDLQNKLGV